MKISTRSIINVSHASTAESLQEILAASLDFPGWYGKNWDAFEECIRTPEQSSIPDVLVIKGLEILVVHLPREANLLQECLVALREKRPEIVIKWESVNE